MWQFEVIMELLSRFKFKLSNTLFHQNYIAYNIEWHIFIGIDKVVEFYPCLFLISVVLVINIEARNCCHKDYQNGKIVIKENP